MNVKTLEVWPKAKKEYEVGDCIGITLSDQIFVDKGNMASDLENPPKLTNRFESRVFWLSKRKISFNRKYLMKINTGEYEVSINKIKKIIDVESLIEKKK